MATAGPSYANLISPLDPSSAVNAYSIQRQQALAQALQAQALTPASDDLPKNMPIMPKVGMGQGLVKLAQALMAGSASDAADTAAGNQQQQNMAGLLRAMSPQGGAPIDTASTALGSGAQSGDVGPTVANAARQDALPSSAPVSNSALNPVGMNPQLAAFMLQSNPEKFFEAQAADSARTPEMKNNAAMGYTPQMQLAAQLAKNKVAGEIDRKAGNQYQNFLTGESGMVPKLPENAQLNGPIGANGSLPDGVSMIRGASGVQEKNADVSAQATAGVRVEKVFNPKTQQYEFTTAKNIADAANSPIKGNVTEQKLGKFADVGSIPPEVATPGYLAELDKEIGRQSDPGRKSTLMQERQRLTSQLGSKPFAAEPALGVGESVKGNVDTVNSHYAALTSTNSNAPTELNALGNIKKYAPGAITGAQAEKREFINGLATLIPGFKIGDDEKTQTDLLNKSAARIVASGGNSGQATDALRTIVAAANPNNKMSVAAINDAVDQLTAIKKMNLSAQTMLDPLKQQNNTAGYQSKLSEFNKTADPAIWQFANASANVRASMKAEMVKSGTAGTFNAKIRALEDMGVKF